MATTKLGKTKVKTAKIEKPVEDDQSFAKLFGAGRDQILIVRQANEQDSSPEVRIFFKPKDLGVCSTAIGFADTEQGWNLADTAFLKADEAFARRIAALIIEELNNPTGAFDQE